MKKIAKKSGFSLVELLAVVVILGILSVITIVSYGRYIKYAREQVDEQNRNTAIMATKSYLNSNSQYRPKAPGDFSEVTIDELIQNNYLKSNEFVDYNKKPYETYSYVSVVKISNGKYKYKAYLFKNGEAREFIDSDNPYIDLDVDTVPDLGKDYINVSDVSFTSKIYADNIIAHGGNSDLTIASYGYVIYVDGLETFNTGVLSGGFKKLTLKNIDLSNFIKISKSNDIKIYFFVKNSKGKITTQTKFTNAKDGNAPICGNISYNTDEWYGSEAFNDNKEKIISVECIDSGGSKCQKRSYTKMWNKQILGTENVYYDTGVINIYDNKNNSTPCTVDIRIDTLPPVVKISAKNELNEDLYSEHEYNGSKNNVIKANAYNNLHEDISNNIKWINRRNINKSKSSHHIVTYKVTSSDNVGIEKYNWMINDFGFDFSSTKEEFANKSNLSSYNYTDFNRDNNNEKSFSFDSSGRRYAIFTAYDKLGNKTSVDIYADIDIDPPSNPTISGCLHNDSDNISSCNGLSSYTFNTWKNGHVLVTAGNASDNVSGLDGYYCTTTGQANNITDSKQSSRNVHTNGIANVGFKARDNAGNESDFVNKIVKLDRSGPQISCSYNNNVISINANDNESEIKEQNKLTSTASSIDNVSANWGDVTTPNCEVTYYAYAKAVNYAGIESKVKCSGSYVRNDCTLKFDCNVRGTTLRNDVHWTHYGCAANGGNDKVHDSAYINYCCIVGKPYNENNCYNKSEMKSNYHNGKSYFDIAGGDKNVTWWSCPIAPNGENQGWELVNDSNWKDGQTYTCSDSGKKCYY